MLSESLHTPFLNYIYSGHKLATAMSADQTKYTSVIMTTGIHVIVVNISVMTLMMFGRRTRYAVIQLDLYTQVEISTGVGLSDS